MRNKITMEMSICQAENGFSNAKAWVDYWQNKMNCVGNVVINIGNYKCFSQNLGQ